MPAPAPKAETESKQEKTESKEEKQEVKNLTEETIRKQTFNISKFIEYLEDEQGIVTERKVTEEVIKTKIRPL